MNACLIIAPIESRPSGELIDGLVTVMLIQARTVHREFPLRLPTSTLRNDVNDIVILRSPNSSISSQGVVKSVVDVSTSTVD